MVMLRMKEDSSLSFDSMMDIIKTLNFRVGTLFKSCDNEILMLVFIYSDIRDNVKHPDCGWFFIQMNSGVISFNNQERYYPVTLIENGTEIIMTQN